MTRSQLGCTCYLQRKLRVCLQVGTILLTLLVSPETGFGQFRLREPDASEEPTDKETTQPKLTAPIVKKKSVVSRREERKVAPESISGEHDDSTTPAAPAGGPDVDAPETAPQSQIEDGSLEGARRSNRPMSVDSARPVASAKSPEEESIQLIDSDEQPSEFFSGPVPRTTSILEDAALRDICQVGEFCCAVGDRGVICISNDGGDSWLTKATPFECQLRSVCFLTNRIGWIGGMVLRSSDSEFSAVVLETRDGGVTWKRLIGPRGNGGSSQISVASLPGVVHLTYFGLDEAVAVTLPAERLKGQAVFRTNDGGMTWTPVATDQPAGQWISADFGSASEGVIGGSQESLATVVADQAIVMTPPRKSLRSVHGVSIDDKSRGWIVGDAASILMTEDSGVTWRGPEGSLPDGFGDIVDLRTVSHQDDVVLAAGSPGSFVLRSDNHGLSWNLIRLPATGLIHRLEMCSEKTAFAVGSFGQILRSVDAGLTWTGVRSPKKRAGVLNLISDSTNASWHLLAQVTAEEGIRSAVVQLSQPFEESLESTRQRWSHRSLSASLTVGVADGTGDWMFARTKPELERHSSLLLNEWDRQTDGRLRELLPLRLARDLRIWRPSVVVIEPSSVGNTEVDAVASIIRDALPRAIELAQSNDHELFQHLQLTPWTVHRVVARSRSEVSSSLNYSDYDLLPRLRTTCGLLSDAPRAILRNGTTADRSATTSHYEISFDQDALTSAATLFEGIKPFLDNSARRVVDPYESDDQKRLQSIVTATKIEASSLAGNRQLGGGDGSLIAHMQTVGESLPESLAIHQLRELGELNLSQNNMDGYLAVQQEIIRRYPQSSAARTAAEVLLIFYSSAETRRYRLQGELQSPVSESTLGGPGGTAAPQLSGAFSSNSSSQLDALNERWDQHAETAYRVLTSHSAQTDTEVNRSVTSDQALRGDILLRLATNFRNQGMSGEHSALLADVSRMPEPFGRFARAEMQITHAAAVPELPTFNIPRRKETPFLDGTLTDTMWEAAEEIRLQAASAAPGGQASATDRPTQPSDFGKASSLVMLGSDDEHLYVAGVFELGETSRKHVTLATHRRHDAPHELRDRFELEIDTDRDYSTAFHFCVDESGLTSEKCWLLDRWDPQWYVSVKRDAQTWRFEAAIPLKELSIRQPPLGTVWRISLRRIQPGAHHMELASSDHISANGSGLMRFIRPKAATPSSKTR